MMEQPDFETRFASLIAKYAELLTGKDTPEIVEKVKIWALYSHIHKTMPALAKHWNSANPQVKPIIKDIFEEMKAMNEALKAESGKDSLPAEQPGSDSSK